jgi:phosphatidylinositol alpha-1,6-mannosyltransferase|tara:strand:+ start:440 stop:1531 length:1092 start_codon:yes stop_codon:yes gene_type:complete
MFVIVTRNFPPDIGGIQSLMEGLSKGLTNHGPVKVFADEYPESTNYDKKSNLQVQRIGGFKIFRKYRKAYAVNEYLKTNKVRAIFFDHWKSIEHIDTKYLTNYQNFCLIHSKEINHPVNSSLNTRMNKAFKKAKFIIANSKYTKELGVSMGLNKDKIQIIHPGTNYPIRLEDGSKLEAKKIFDHSFPKIITIARLDKRKSHQNILMTIKNLIPTYPEIKYICVGNGDEKNNLEQLRKELDIEKQVIFLPKINENLKVALLDKCDLFLMPSVIYKKSVEGFGISFIEAGSYGKASIGGLDGGQADAIEQGRTGYLCDGNDLNSIYETILKSLQNDQYKILGLQAKEFSKKFKWENIVKQYLSLI